MYYEHAPALTSKTIHHRLGKVIQIDQCHTSAETGALSRDLAVGFVLIITGNVQKVNSTTQNVLFDVTPDPGVV